MLIVDQERRWDLTFPLVPAELQAQLWDLLPAHQWLAENGVTFANHYASGIPCSPARSSIYTGFHAPDTQIINVMEFMTQSLGVYLPPTQPVTLGDVPFAMPTIADLLNLGGGGTPYYCAYKGKVHFALDKDLPDSEALHTLYGFKDWTRQKTAYYDSALSGAYNEQTVAQDAADWLIYKAPELSQPWLLAVNLINPHDVQYANVAAYDPCKPWLPPGLDHTVLGIAPIPLRAPYFNWWCPQKPPNFGLPPATTAPRPQAVDAFAGILSVSFGNIPFDDDALCAIYVSPGETLQVPMWQAYLNYYINCILDADVDLWTVIQAFLGSGADLANTWIVYLSDHGEMATSQAGLSAVYNGVHFGPLLGLEPRAPEMMPLRSKGSLQFEEAAHVPLIFAAAPVPGSVLPDANRATTVAALSSHVDIVPTLLDLAGVPRDWYEKTFGPYLSQLDPPLLKALPGTSLAAILAKPSTYRDTLRWSDANGNGRSRVLITGDALDTFDPFAAWALADFYFWDLHLDFRVRAMMRAMVAVDAAGSQLVKFGRWFSAHNYAEQAVLAGSYGLLHAPEGDYLGQDVQVFALGTDPHEQNNLATTLSDSEISSLSESLNALMAAELSAPGLTPRETHSFLSPEPQSQAAAAARGASPLS
ncbi:MAG TPA: sulfatase-like hydrolase/transferase [Thermoanaerobaculia bacterium]